VQRRKFSAKILLQISFCIDGDLALREIEAKHGHSSDNNYHGSEQPNAKAR
jgi:hypothetical protein